MQVDQWVNKRNYIGCVMKPNLTNITLNISQPDIINKMNQGFNRDFKSRMTFNTLDTPNTEIIINQETDTKI